MKSSSHNVTRRDRIASRQSGLSATKRKLLERWKKGMAADRPAAIPRRPAGEETALSFAQQRLWFLDQLEPGNPAYNVPAAVSLAGRLDIAACRRALGEIVRRHEALRTHFESRPSEPVQEVQPSVRTALPVIDLEGLPEVEAEASRWMVWEARQSFDLATGPMLRSMLLKLAGERHLLLLTMHHIVCDGWAVEVLVREFATLYGAFSQGKDSPLAELTIQYPDYAHWQRQWLTGEVLQEQLAYWQRQLAGCPTQVELPTDRARPAGSSFRGSRLSFDLPDSLSQALRELGQGQGATLFMTLMTVFQVLIQRYTGKTDLVVGTPVANRRRVEVEPLIGLFVNTLALRADLGGNPTLTELLRRVQKVALAAFSHQDLPFERLVESFRLERDISRTPLVQVMFTVQGSPLKPMQVPGLEVALRDVDSGTARLDLFLNILESGPRLRGTFFYRSDLLNATTMGRMAVQFERLLAAMVADPDQRLETLSLLSDPQRQQLLVEWSDTAADLPSSCLHELVEAQARRRPETIAISCAARQLSYRELSRRSARLSARLRRLGVGPEVLVGLCVERSPEMVAGMLGILGAGGAYVPLDPDYPTERLAFVLEETRAPVLITEQGVVPRLPPYAGKTIFLDTELAAPAVAADGDRLPQPRARPENLAYVLYTSGSTGRPKGVQICHRALVNFLTTMSSRPGLGEHDVLAAVTTLAFDISGLELYLPLWVGGRVEVISREMAADGVALSGRLAAVGATAMQATPLSWRLLLAAGWQAPRGFAMLCGGEALPGDLADLLLRGRGQLWNLYGPTETTIWSSVLRVEAGADLSLGRPIANTGLHLLDRGLRPVPVGVTGDVCLGGEGLARGYLRRPAPSAEKFVPDPFSENPGARLYRTGDLARRRPDGNPEFLGRTDHQVKVRGFRIELGEIEVSLSRHPGVAEAVVLARRDASGEMSLAAFIVADGESAPAADELRNHLHRDLPGYMVPPHLVFLPSLPRSPAGKVDRKALAALVEERSSAREETEPRTAVEELVAAIWCEVLGVEWVGVHDSFFDLGGHSLLATQLISRLPPVFGLELSIRELFDTPTVAGLAAKIETGQKYDRGLEAPLLVADSKGGKPPLSFAQHRLWVLDQLGLGSSAYNLPAAIEVRGALHPEVLARALGEIIRRHEILRTTFATEHGNPVQIVGPPEPLRLPLVDLSGLAESVGAAQAQRLALAQARRPFDLERGPLVRAALLRRGEEGHVFLVSMHHIVSDNWSLGILIRELGTLYEHFASGRPSPLQNLKIQYGDFAHWQRNWLSEEALEVHLAYWKPRLEGPLPVLELPLDHPRPPVKSYRGARRPFCLGPDLGAALAQLGQQRRATLFITLLTALKVLLYRYSGQTDLVVGSPIANRTRVEIEDLIGFFVNTVVLRTKLSGNLRFVEFLEQVREISLEAYVHQDLPFEKLVEELQPERSLAHTPLLQVALAWQEATLEGIELPGLSLRPLELDAGTSKFDLNWLFWEGQQGLSGAVEFSTDLFDTTTVQRMNTHLQVLLQGAVADPEARLDELRLLAPSERYQLLQVWRGEPQTFSEAGSLSGRFEGWVATCGEAVASVCEDRWLTYRELDRRAERLANRLAARGVGPEVRIGICAERSLSMIVAILGILRAGGAYVPLDPAQPAERLTFILEDAQVPLLLWQQQQQRTPPTGFTGEVLYLGDDGQDGGGESSPGRDSGVMPNNTAYVIYTSGSTGTPKGAPVSHDNVLRLFAATRRWFAFEPGDAWTLFHSFGFDFSVWEIWGALLHGGRLVVVPYLESRSPEEFHQLVCRERITVLNQTPSAFRHFQRAEESAAVPGLGLRWVIFGGEALDFQSLRPWFERHGDVRPRLVNMYGITETTVHVTYRSVAAADVEGPAGSLIGAPIPDLQLYVLTRRLQLAPIGVPGELFVGGAGLCRGYVNRPGLTAERFVPSPFGPGSGERLYRTGDLVRFRSDGESEYLGRTDFQVKVRGFRIELGEIEALLGQHPDLQKVVVTALEAAGGGQHLVAYLVTDREPPPGVRELRTWLGEKLPEYMVPAVFVFLEALPETPNGKIDRRALPAPGPERPELTAAAIMPGTPNERVLTEIWSQVLAIDSIGVGDNFFELGGDSILAIQVVTKAKEKGLCLSPGDLFRHQTLVELARVVQEETPSRVVLSEVIGDVPLTPVQHWFFERDLPQHHHFNQAVLLAVQPALRPRLLERALGGLQAHHDALRLRFERRDGCWQQANSGGNAAVPLLWISLEGLPEGVRTAAFERAATELQGSLDLGRGPIYRVALFDFGPQRKGRLLWIMHHLAVDGVSWRVLLTDLELACRQAEHGREITLAAKTTSFKQWSEALKRYARSDSVKEEAAIWLDRPGEELRPLPVDVLRGGNTMASARTVKVALRTAETKELLAAVPKIYRTRIDEVLLAVLAQAFQEWTGESRFLVDLEGHGREEFFEDLDLSRTVGWFTTIYPVLLDLRYTSHPGEVLKAAKEKLRAVPKRGIGYGVLCYLAGGEETARRLRGLQPAEILFNYLGQLDQTLSESSLFALSREPCGPLTGRGGLRSHLLEINAWVSRSRLEVSWIYSQNMHRRATVESLAEGFLKAMRRLLDHCRSPEAGGYTPSDFPEAKLGQQDLDKLIRRIKGRSSTRVH